MAQYCTREKAPHCLLPNRYVSQHEPSNKMKLKTLSITVIYTLVLFVGICQDTLKIEKLIKWEETEFNFNKYLKPILIELKDKQPVTGWVRIESKNRLSIRHYRNGIEDGYSATYIKKRGTYHLNETRLYTQGEIELSANFSSKKQHQDSNSYSWGLISFKIWNPNPFDKKLVCREIKDIEKNEVIEYKYYPETNMKLKVKYRTMDSVILMKKNIENLGMKYFPNILNERTDFFSFIRYDGYYFYNQCEDTNCLNGTSFVIKFYPNGSIRMKKLDKITKDYYDWESCSEYQISFSNPINTTANHFNLIGKEINSHRGYFIPTGLFMEVQEYGYGPYFRHYLYFKKE